MANELGVSLTGIQQVSEGGSRVFPLRRATAFSTAATTPVEPGQIQVNASVNVTYQLGAFAGRSK